MLSFADPLSGVATRAVEVSGCCLDLPERLGPSNVLASLQRAADPLVSLLVGQLLDWSQLVLLMVSVLVLALVLMSASAYSRAFEGVVLLMPRVSHLSQLLVCAEEVEAVGHPAELCLMPLRQFAVFQTSPVRLKGHREEEAFGALNSKLKSRVTLSG